MAKRADENQSQIVAGLRAAGCSILHLHEVGHGCPDILCFHPRTGRYHLMEIKNGSLSLSRRKLTPDEERFHKTWKGPILIIESLDAALKAIGLV